MRQKERQKSKIKIFPESNTFKAIIHGLVFGLLACIFIYMLNLPKIKSIPYNTLTTGILTSFSVVFGFLITRIHSELKNINRNMGHTDPKAQSIDTLRKRIIELEITRRFTFWSFFVLIFFLTIIITTHDAILKSILALSCLIILIANAYLLSENQRILLDEAVDRNERGAMSRFQQIRVRVEPVWEKGLARDLPRVCRLLSRVEPSLAEAAPAPPLTELVHHLVRLSQRRDLEPEVERALEEHGPAITEAKEAADAAIGSWKLGRAERHLNEMEDAFLALEHDLAREA